MNPVRTEPTEAEFTDQVIAFARLHRWRVAHFRPAKTSRGWRTPVQGDGKGFPDLVLVRGLRLVFAELKVGRNKTSPEQGGWIAALMGANQSMFVWYPGDWPNIERILGGTA